MTELSLTVGITHEYPCSYLTGQQERLVVVQDRRFFNLLGYESLLEAGFRRNGDDLYRPYCVGCSACESLRIDVHHFIPSTSQKRVLRNGAHLRLEVSSDNKPDYYLLYQRYIESRHDSGSMCPPSPEQYQRFILSSWFKPLFFEVHSQDQLIAVAVTDELPHSLSALYTFFDPDAAHYSPGRFAILKQIEYALNRGKYWLYLGFQIEGCRKMNYKRQYQPYQCLSADGWQKSQDSL